MSKYGRVTRAEAASMALDMVNNNLDEVWRGDTRLTREADGIITEWHVTHEHVNGRSTRVELE